MAKGYIIVDIPVDDPVEIDEYGMVADMFVWPMTLTDRKELDFYTPHVCIRPLPEIMKYPRTIDEDDIMPELLSFAYRKGFNDCLKEILKDD